MLLVRSQVRTEWRQCGATIRGGRSWVSRGEVYMLTSTKSLVAKREVATQVSTETAPNKNDYLAIYLTQPIQNRVSES